MKETEPMKMEQSVPKRRHIKFRPRGITQKKAYNIVNNYYIRNLELEMFSVRKIYVEMYVLNGNGGNVDPYV
jgi:hypothetical protein